MTSGGFPSKFSKCCFHRCIRSCWLAAFVLALAAALPSAHFIYCLPCNPLLSIFKRVSNLIDLIFYVFCLFFLGICQLNHFVLFLSFRALVLVGFFLLHLVAIFVSAFFSLTANVSHGSLYCVFLFSWNEFRHHFLVGVDKILIFFIRSVCFCLFL